MATELRHDESEQRYELLVDGELASLTEYRERDGALDFVHTETRDGFGGQGLAEQVVGFALDDVAAKGRRIRPYCSFVADHIDANPQYAGLVAD